MNQWNSGLEALESMGSNKQDRVRCVKLKTQPTAIDIKITREEMHLSQSDLASLLGISMRTLQDWEQGRRNPSSAAKSLLLIAKKYPHIIKEIFVK